MHPRLLRPSSKIDHSSPTFYNMLRYLVFSTAIFGVVYNYEMIIMNLERPVTTRTNEIFQTTTSSNNVKSSGGGSIPAAPTKNNDKRVAFVGNVDSFRLGGGEFFEITKKLFELQPIMTDINNHSIYKIRSEDIVSKLETGELFNTQWCVCNYFLGWMTDWNMDIILWNKRFDVSKSDLLLNQTSSFISEYDILFYYAAFGLPENSFPLLSDVDSARKIPQKRFKIEVEADYAAKLQQRYSNGTTSSYSEFASDYQSQHGFLPIVVDVWGLMSHDYGQVTGDISSSCMWKGVHSLPMITWHYKYPIKYMQQVVANAFKNRSYPECNEDNYDDDNEVLIFLSRRCNMKGQLKEYFDSKNNDNDNDNVTTNATTNKRYQLWYHNHNPKQNLEYIPFYCKLSKSKFVFHFENYISAGQTVGEAAAFGVPTFGYATKYFESLLMPRFLFIGQHRDWEELVQKVEFLEDNPLYYTNLQIQTRQRSKQLFVDEQYSPDDFLDDVHNTLQQQQQQSDFQI